jgi:hypothetical protein
LKKRARIKIDARSLVMRGSYEKLRIARLRDCGI